MLENNFPSTKSTSDLHETIDLNLLCMNPFEVRESVQKRVSYRRMKTAISGRNSKSNSIVIASTAATPGGTNSNYQTTFPMMLGLRFRLFLGE